MTTWLCGCALNNARCAGLPHVRTSGESVWHDLRQSGIIAPSGGGGGSGGGFTAGAMAAAPAALGAAAAEAGSMYAVAAPAAEAESDASSSVGSACGSGRGGALQSQVAVSPKLLHR